MRGAATLVCAIVAIGCAAYAQDPRLMAGEEPAAVAVGAVAGDLEGRVADLQARVARLEARIPTLESGAGSGGGAIARVALLGDRVMERLVAMVARVKHPAGPPPP